jgi:hypothetical protein
MADPDLFLFVSHISEDRPATLEIVDELERRGVPCWIAPRDVRAGRAFDDEIAEAIEASRAMLLIFSERCNEHEYIRREITVAGESHKVIIPFRIENAPPRCGLRIRLSDLHWIDGFVSRERAIGEVVRTIDPERTRRHEDEHRAHEEKRRRDEEEHRFQQQVEEQWLRQQQEERRCRQEEEKHQAEAGRQVSELSSDQLPWLLRRRSQITLSFLSIILKLLATLLKPFGFQILIFPPLLAIVTLLVIIYKRTNTSILYLLIVLNLLVTLLCGWLFFTVIPEYQYISIDVKLLSISFSLVIIASLIEIAAVTFNILRIRASD